MAELVCSLCLASIWADRDLSSFSFKVDSFMVTSLSSELVGPLEEFVVVDVDTTDSSRAV